MPGPLDELWHPLDETGWPIANINKNTQMNRQYPVWAGPPPRRFDRPVSPYTHPFLTPEYGWQDRPENPALSDAPPEIPAPWARWPYRDRSRYVPGRDPEHLSLPYQALRQPAGDPVNDPTALMLLLRSLGAR